jgi:Fe2+ or Zn2+ uptake regulation protein
MERMQYFETFYKAIGNDTRIGPVHVSVYMALLNLWEKQGRVNPIHIFSRDVMPMAKISGIATYYRTLRELDRYGYIKYISTYDRVTGSVVYFLEIKPQIVYRE